MPGRIRVLELRSVRGTGGGPEKTIMRGAEQADRARFDVVVCYIRDDRDEVYRLDERAARLGIDYVEVRERHSFDLTVWSKLKGIARQRAIDIVHAHDYKTDLLALLLARRMGIVALATAHGWASHSARERFVYYPADKRLLARFPRVVAVSGSVKRILLDHGACEDRISLLLNAIDPADFRRSPGRRDDVRRTLGYSKEDFVVGAVGRLHPVKRFDLLMEAIAALATRHSHLCLAIVGDGPLRLSLELTASRLGIERRCRLLGQRDDLIDLYQALDVVVQSSESEGAPNVVLEAMAMEVPLIATDVGGTRELATPDDHALVVPRHDVGALTRAIEAVMSDPAASATRAHAARRRVESELSFEVRTRRLEAIYVDLVRERQAVDAAGIAHHA